MKFRIAFGIFEAEVELPGVNMDPDTEEFKEAVVSKLEIGGLNVLEVVAT